MKGHARRIVAGSVVALALGAAGILVWLRAELHTPHAGWAGDHVDVVLERGLDAGSMLNRLAEAGVLLRPWAARLWLNGFGSSQSLQAGEYRFDRPATPLEVLARLRSGDVLLHPVTVPEGLTLWEVAERLSAAGFSDEPMLVAAFRDGSLLAEDDPAATDLEGYLFPDTYHFPRDVTAGTVARTLVGRFFEVIGSAYVERAAATGLGLREAVTLASMIEKETGVSGERSRISAVFHNRLARGMRLQCDPTVIYAHRREGIPVTGLQAKHLEFDSPWNTYRVKRLPPGPIASPGKASLEAAVEPLKTEDLYFVAAPEGGHRFSTDLRSHIRAVAEWRSYSRSSR